MNAAKRSGSFLIGAILLLSGSLVQAQEPATIDPQATEIVKRMSDLLASQEAFSVHAEILFDEVLEAGPKLQFAAALDTAVRRPDGLVVDYSGDLGGKRAWYDGKTFTLLDTSTDVYATISAPATLDAMLVDFQRDYGLALPLAVLARSDPYAVLMKGARDGSNLGVHDVGGKPCHHLAFVSDEVDWQIWIDAGEKPLPCKLVITRGGLPESPQYMAVLSDWKFPSALPAEEFSAQGLEGADQIEFLPAKETVK